MRTVLAWICRGLAVIAALLAYHIPVGVLILFLAYLTAAMSFGLRLARGQARLVESAKAGR